MRYAMVGTDYDSTLCPPSLVIGEYTKRVVREYVSAGGVFTLCTGRMYRSIKREAAKLDLHGLVICYQGALIRDLDTDEIVESVTVDTDSAVEYIRFMKERGAQPQFYMDDVLIVEKMNAVTERYCSFCGVEPVVAGNLERYLSLHTGRLNKVFCFIDPERQEEVMAEAAERFENRLLVDCSQAHNIEAVDISASKGKALVKLAARYGIDIKNVLSFGDNLNDMSLMTCGACGVAVGNAAEALKRAAAFVCGTVYEEGVAQTIERTCLRSEE